MSCRSGARYPATSALRRGQCRRLNGWRSFTSACTRASASGDRSCLLLCSRDEHLDVGHKCPATRAELMSPSQMPIRAWTAEHGRGPSYHEWTPSRSSPGVWEAESPRWPSAAVVCDAYADYRNPWNAALIDAGASVRFQRWSDEAIRAALADFWARTGRAPVNADLSTSTWNGPTARTLRRRYGNVTCAWETLGPVPTPTGDGHPEAATQAPLETVRS